VGFFPQKEGDTALTTWLKKKLADILYQGWSWQRAIGNIREWRNCQSCDLLPGVVLPARLGLPIQTWQSDMVKAFQEIEQYCYEWELLLLFNSNYFNLTHWAAMRPSAPYFFFYLSNGRRFYSSMEKLCSLMD
jgi:hypothetical protein